MSNNYDRADSESATTAADYRTTIDFLTSPSPTASAMKCEEASQKKDCALTTAAYLHSASSTPPSRPRQQQHPVSLPVTNNGIATASVDTNGKYRDDELTGMAGLMELASPPDHQTTATPATTRNAAYEYNSNRTLTNSNQHAIPPALNITQSPYMPQQQQQQQSFYQYYQPHSNSDNSPRYSMQHNSATTLVGVLTPDSMPHKPTRSFPATIDDVQQVARRRSQSTDSFQPNNYPQQQPTAATSALPYVLNNANIRNRSHTSTQQRQRTSDTPLFPILLHRIINDPQNASWIRWCEEGTAFKFSSAENLLSCLQAAGLRAQNYHSIEKNLNDYRFTRLTDQRRKIPDMDGKLWWMFSHPQFLRDNPDGIVSIQRRRRTTNLPPSSASPQNSANTQLRHQQLPMPPHNAAALIYTQQPPPLPPPQQPGSWM